MYYEFPSISYAYVQLYSYIKLVIRHVSMLVGEWRTITANSIDIGLTSSITSGVSEQSNLNDYDYAL